jgi:hypothetical protein
MRAVALSLAWLLPCVLVWAWFFGGQFRGLTAPETMDAAQVGRQISEGQGFTTKLVRPLSLATVPRAHRHPELYNAPVYPLLLGVAFNLLGPEDRTVALVSSAFGLLSVILAYLLASRLLDRRAGWLAATLVCLHVGLLRAGVSGSSTAALAFVAALLFYAILVHRNTLRWSALCGAVAGLAGLTEYGMLPLALPAGAMVAWRQPRARLQHVGVFAVGFAVVVLPWLARTWVASGDAASTLNAYSLATYSTTYPQMTLYRSASPEAATPLAFIAGNGREVARKLLTDLGALQASLPGILGICPLILLGLALFVDLGSDSGNQTKWAVVAGILLVGTGLALGQPRFELLMGLLPLVLAIGAVAFTVALASRRLSRLPRVAAAACLIAVCAFPVVIAGAAEPRHVEPNRKNLEYIGRALPTDAVVVTDQPWAVAWYADRVAVWIPEAPALDPEEHEDLTLAEAADVTLTESFVALTEAGASPGAIFLSAALPQYSPTERVGQWQLLHGLMREQVEALQHGRASGKPWTPPGWTLAASLPPQEFLLVRAAADETPHTESPREN